MNVRNDVPVEELGLIRLVLAACRWMHVYIVMSSSHHVIVAHPLIKLAGHQTKLEY